ERLLAADVAVLRLHLQPVPERVERVAGARDPRLDDGVRRLRDLRRAGQRCPRAAVVGVELPDEEAEGRQRFRYEELGPSVRGRLATEVRRQQAVVARAAEVDDDGAEGR